MFEDEDPTFIFSIFSAIGIFIIICIAIYLTTSKDCKENDEVAPAIPPSSIPQNIQVLDKYEQEGKQSKWDCIITQNNQKKCIQSQYGLFDTKTECEENCTKFACTQNGNCIKSAEGEFLTLADCKNNCSNNNNLYLEDPLYGYSSVYNPFYNYSSMYNPYYYYRNNEYCGYEGCTKDNPSYINIINNQNNKHRRPRSPDRRPRSPDRRPRSRPSTRPRSRPSTRPRSRPSGSVSPNRIKGFRA